MTAYEFRLTKYYPHLRDERGAYMGDDWTSISDIGKTFSGRQLTLADYLDVEGKHLEVIASFMGEAGVEALQATAVEKRDGGPALNEGQRLSRGEVIEVVRAMLREQAWCQLKAGDGFYISVGFDFYVFVGSEDPSEGSIDLAQRLGLFVDRDFPNPYEHEDDS